MRSVPAAGSTIATVLKTDYAGVLVRDGWQVYRCYKDSLHQSCINHLLRRAKALQEDHPYSPWGAEVKAVLQAAWTCGTAARTAN